MIPLKIRQYLNYQSFKVDHGGETFIVSYLGSDPPMYPTIGLHYWKVTYGSGESLDDAELEHELIRNCAEFGNLVVEET